MKIAAILVILNGAAFAQAVAPPPPPAGPVYPVPAPAPMAQPAPAAKPARPAAPAPMPAFAPDQVDLDALRDQIDRARDEADRVRDQIGNFQLDRAIGDQQLRLAEDLARLKVESMAPFAYAPQRVFTAKGRGIDGLYDAGARAIDNHRYEEALEDFNQVISRGGQRADGALYWKAYTLNKLGRRDDALAAIAELRKSYASSRWLDDAKALELEVRQSSGQRVSPESESDDDLKLLALNALVHSDPDRALPILEELLKSGKSPKLKRNALYVLAQNNTPRAQQLLEQVARGKGNPDLQLAAISYLGERRRTNTGPVLLEIYNGSSDVTVKRRVLSAFRDQHDNDRLLEIAKSEKNPDLRVDAIRYIADTGNQARLVDLMMRTNDGKPRAAAVGRAGEQQNSAMADALAGIYANEKEPAVRTAIIDALAAQRNGKALVACARKETDPKLKRTLVERMAGLNSPEVNEYLMEILK